MNNEIVLQQLDNGLLTITMNRPDRRNALNPDMTRGLVEAARRAAEDHEVRAVLLKGAGGTFCVGGDVKSMAEGRAPLPFEAKKANLRRGMEVSRILHEMQKPVVAQVDGAAAGAGLSIALACDLRVASASAQDHHRLRQGRTVRRLRRHLFPDPDARQRQGARTLSDVAGADGAGSPGARHGDQSACPTPRSRRRRMSWRCRWRRGRRSRSATSRRTSTTPRHMSLEACFDAEAMHHSRSGETADHKEAAKAFVEKRKPVFQGH